MIENDRTALHFEGSLGRVPEKFSDTISTELQAWLWAIALGMAGTAALAGSGAIVGNPSAVTIQFCIWLAVLVFTRGAFSLYNRVTPDSRVAFYPILQACRSFAVLAFAAANVIGLLLLAAHMLARVLPYYFYRYTPLPGQGSRWPYMPVYSVRLSTFVLLLIGLAVSQREPGILVQLQTIVILGWCLFRARNELRDGVKHIQFLDRT